MRASGGCRAFARDDALEHVAKRRGRKVRHLDLGVLDGSYQTLESAILVRRHLRRIGDFDRTRFHDAFTSRCVMLKTQRVNRRLTCTCRIVAPAPAPVQSPRPSAPSRDKLARHPSGLFEIFSCACRLLRLLHSARRGRARNGHSHSPANYLTVSPETLICGASVSPPR